MRTIKTGGHTIEIYESIEELPIERFHKFNKSMLIDAGVGSDLASIDNHFERIIRYIRTDKKKEAEREIQNLRMNIYFIQQNISPKYLAFAALVKSIDGKAKTDLSDDALMAIVEELKDVVKSELNVDAIKGRIDKELSAFFPDIFNDASVKEKYDDLKKRTLLILQGIAEGVDNTAQVEEITDRMLSSDKPQNYTDFEVMYDKDFELLCLNMSEAFHVRAKDFTTREYYSAYNVLKERYKQLNKK